MNRTAQDIGDELYALAPQAFTAARDGYIAEAKEAGGRALAADLAALKRPSVAAGLVNLVALRRPDSVERLIQLGQTIREAQGNVTPQQLRDLSARRRKELDDVVSLAQSLAAERGDATPTRAALTEVESTFAAAMADDASARVVRDGRAIRALSYSGFGEAAGGASAAAVFGTAPPPPATKARPTSQAQTTRPTSPPSGHDDHPSRADAKAAARKEAEEAAARAEAEQAQRREAARERVNAAREVVSLTTAAHTDSESEVQRLSEEIAELRNQLDIAQRDARAARQARLAAERDLATAERLLNRYA
jgi:hypothetical protein